MWDLTSPKGDAKPWVETVNPPVLVIVVAVGVAPGWWHPDTDLGSKYGLQPVLVFYMGLYKLKWTRATYLRKLKNCSLETC